MDAYALLSAQGWRGTGHSLHKTDDSIGLSKPLLLNKKEGKKGLGGSQHFTSDQWWMNAFDEQLKGLDTSKKGVVVQTVKAGKLNSLERGSLAKYSIYNTFVRGGFLEGTLPTPDDTASSGTDSDRPDGRDKSTSKAGTTESKEERKARRAEKRKRKEERALRRAARQQRREEKKEKADIKKLAREQKRLRREKKEEKRRKEKTEAEKSKKS